MFKPFLLFFYIVLLVNVAYTTDYCRICKNRSHTMCKYKSGPSKSCRNYSSVEMKTELRNRIVKLHNTLRNKVASGKETQGKNEQSQPSAVNMLMMYWDDELAAIGQRWADQCTPASEENQHDECKETDRFDIGQNVVGAINPSDTVTDFGDLIEQMIMEWYSEVKRVEPEDVDKFKENTGPDNEIGHYAQMVWAKTKFVGCAHVSFVEGDKTMSRLICNYGPTGNIVDAAIYKRGKPCSECKCNKEYQALCEDVQDVESTTFFKNLYLTFDTKKSIEDYEPPENFRDTPFFNLEPAALHYDENLLNYQQEPEQEEEEEVDVTENATETRNPTEYLPTENDSGISKPSYSNLPQKLFDLLEVVRHFNLSSNSELLLDLYKLYNKYKENATTALTPIETESNPSEYSEYDDEIEFRKEPEKKPAKTSSSKKSKKGSKEKADADKKEKKKKKQAKEPPEKSPKKPPKKTKKPSKESEKKEKLPKKDKKPGSKPNKQKKNRDKPKKDEEDDKKKKPDKPEKPTKPSALSKKSPVPSNTPQTVKEPDKNSHKGHKHIHGECPYEKPRLPYTFLRREGDACFCLYRIRSCSTKSLVQTLLLLLLLLYCLVFQYCFY